MDSSQSPSPNDQRHISTTEPAIGVDPAELSAPSPDAAPQPVPVNPTTLVPSAKTFELMRQLEALAHEVAVVSRGDSSDQCIKAQEGSNFSAGLQLIEPSIRVSPHDQLAGDSPSFGRRTILTLANFFIAARDWLASYRPFGRRTFPTLASFFIAALIGVAAAFVLQTQRVSTAKPPNGVAVAEKQSGFTPVGQLSLQDAPQQIAPATQIAPASTAPATSSELVQQFDGMARDLVVLQRRAEELAAKQEHLVDAQEQLAARQEQMAQNIAKPQTVKLPRPRPPLSVPPDRR